MVLLVSFKLTIILGSFCHCRGAGHPVPDAGERQHLQLIQDKLPQA